mmetsp:Transcript_32354/g.54539  ORF Transcript_32354/g.54539 Transcript_32354/m.54539 type:complete len:272 (-) Transcript_32354:2358-3173(-)
MSFRLGAPSRVKNGAPLSPSDNILSPVSRQLSMRKQFSIAAGISLADQLKPTINPCGTLKLVLGSSSKNRREVLEAIQWDYTPMSADIDEKSIRHDDPMEMPVVIAKAKAEELIKREKMDISSEPLVLVTCDQIVLFQGQVREKPENEMEAREFLSSYSGSEVRTVSAVVATYLPDGTQRVGVDVATVRWEVIPDDVVERVLARGQIYTSAGGFRIEDPDLSLLIRDMDKGADSIMGMPLDLTTQLIEAVLPKGAATGASIADSVAVESKK